MSFSPSTTGPLYPSPIDFSQRIGGPFSGQEVSNPVSGLTPFRSGPRNCGQSAAKRGRNSPQRHKEHKQRNENFHMLSLCVLSVPCVLLVPSDRLPKCMLRSRKSPFADLAAIGFGGSEDL